MGVSYFLKVVEVIKSRLDLKNNQFWSKKHLKNKSRMVKKSHLNLKKRPWLKEVQINKKQPDQKAKISFIYTAHPLFSLKIVDLDFSFTF